MPVQMQTHLPGIPNVAFEIFKDIFCVIHVLKLREIVMRKIKSLLN